MRVAPMFASLEVCQTSRSALTDQLGKTYIGIRKSFPRSLVDQPPSWTEACFLPCTRPPDACGFYIVLTSVAAQLQTGPKSWVPLRIRDGLSPPTSRTLSCSTPSLCTIIPCKGTSRTMPHVLGGTHHLCSRPSRHLLRRAAHPEGTSSF
jgi:hypothetical protein